MPKSHGATQGRIPRQVTAGVFAEWCGLPKNPSSFGASVWWITWFDHDGVAQVRSPNLGAGGSNLPRRGAQSSHRPVTALLCYWQTISQ